MVATLPCALVSGRHELRIVVFPDSAGIEAGAHGQSVDGKSLSHKSLSIRHKTPRFADRGVLSLNDIFRTVSERPFSEADLSKICP